MKQCQQGGDAHEWESRAELDEDLLKYFVSTVTLPFEAGVNATVAVKIVDDLGIESLKIMKLTSLEN